MPPVARASRSPPSVYLDDLVITDHQNVPNEAGAAALNLVLRMLPARQHRLALRLDGHYPQ